jgi:hypothetical protein
LVTEEGTCLTPEVKKRFEAAVQKQRENPSASKQARKIEGPEQATGYVGVIGLGPGGSVTRAVSHLHSHRVDLQITINQSNETPLNVTPETQEYYDGLQKTPTFVTVALEAFVQNLAR